MFLVIAGGRWCGEVQQAVRDQSQVEASSHPTVRASLRETPTARGQGSGGPSTSRPAGVPCPPRACRIVRSPARIARPPSRTAGPPSRTARPPS
ncbi:MAG: hypothetical protein F4X98_08785 [Gammaproteobacteria bacterium]|nr:hypothetical protein [Gammaproteobacteria bacterium]